jgi:hypothetical protein
MLIGRLAYVRCFEWIISRECYSKFKETTLVRTTFLLYPIRSFVRSFIHSIHRRDQYIITAQDNNDEPVQHMWLANEIYQIHQDLHYMLVVDPLLSLLAPEIPHTTLLSTKKRDEITFSMRFNAMPQYRNTLVWSYTK